MNSLTLRLLACLSVVLGSTSMGFAWESQTKVWNGYTRHDFAFQGKKCFIVVPKKAADGNPWVWRARFPGFHTQADIELLGRGFHIAHIDTGGMLGSPQAMDLWDKFYVEMTTQYDLSDRVALEAVSRGGLFAYRWASRNAERVACIYADTPVCDFKSWPLGQGTGMGSAGTWKQLLREYGLSHEEALQWKKNPIDVLEPIAKRNVPLLHIVSLNDRVVPPGENTFVLAKTYQKLGGTIEIIKVKEGTKSSNGHHFTHPNPSRVADFIEMHAGSQTR